MSMISPLATATAMRVDDGGNTTHKKTDNNNDLKKAATTAVQKQAQQHSRSSSSGGCPDSDSCNCSNSSTGSVATRVAGMLSPPFARMNTASRSASPTANSSQGPGVADLALQSPNNTDNDASDAGFAPFSDNMIARRTVSRIAYSAQAEAVVPDIDVICFNSNYDAETTKKVSTDELTKTARSEQNAKAKQNLIDKDTSCISHYMRAHPLGRIGFADRLIAGFERFYPIRCVSQYVIVFLKTYQMETAVYMVDLIEQVSLLFIHWICMYFFVRAISTYFLPSYLHF